MADMLEKVKRSLGITGEYQDDTLTEYINEVKQYLTDAGVPDAIISSDLSAGVISRGVSDLWNYGTGKLSDYFYQRASQLIYAFKSSECICFAAGDYGQSFPVNIEGLEINEGDIIYFSCEEIIKEFPEVHDNCILITFTKEESESLEAGTYLWTLKVKKEAALISIVTNGVLIVT